MKWSVGRLRIFLSFCSLPCCKGCISNQNDANKQTNSECRHTRNNLLHYLVPFPPSFYISSQSQSYLRCLQSFHEETTAAAIATKQAKALSLQFRHFVYFSLFVLLFLVAFYVPYPPPLPLHLLKLLRNHVAIVFLQLSSNQRQSLEVTCLMNDNKSRLKTHQLVSSTPVVRRVKRTKAV